MARATRVGWYTLAVLGLSGVLAGCGVVGGSAGDALSEWWLVDATPDRQLLEVTTLGGGCSEFVGWVSDADEDQVHVQARWETTDADACDAMLRVETLVLDLTEPLGDRTLAGCGHDACLALPAEGDEHQTFPARIRAGGPGALVSGPTDVWGVGPDGTIAWHRAHDGDPERALDELGLLDERAPDGSGVLDGPLTGSEDVAPGSGDTARLQFDGEGTWLEVLDDDTGQRRHRILVIDPEAPVGPPVRLDDARIVLGQQQPDRLWVVDVVAGDIQELDTGAGRVQGVVDGVVITANETRIHAVDVDAGPVLWEAHLARDGERIVVGPGALAVFDRAIGRLSLLDPRRGDAVWTADLGMPPGVEVAAIDDTLLVTSSRTLFAFDRATGEPHGWTALWPERTVTVGGTHPPHTER